MKSFRSPAVRPILRHFSQTSIPRISKGDRVPGIQLTRSSQDDKVSLAELTRSKRAVILGVPAAFSPNCTASHIPGYIKAWPQLKERGINDIYVVSVNDHFVVNTWKDSMLKGSTSVPIHFLADPDAKWSKACDTLFDASALLGNHRSKRLSLLVEDGKVSQVNIEPTNIGLDVSSAESMLKSL